MKALLILAFSLLIAQGLSSVLLQTFYGELNVNHTIEIYNVSLLTDDVIRFAVQFNSTGVVPSINTYFSSPTNNVIFALQSQSNGPIAAQRTITQPGIYSLMIIKNGGSFVVNLQAEVVLISGCRDGVKGGNQQCDNRNQTGCILCVKSYGYTCSQDANLFSTCRTVCGDGIKVENEQCDNRNQTGCILCVKSYGYTCSQDANLFSTCRTVCGDGIKVENEQCDNRNETGCINCIKSARYACVQDANLLSTCIKLESFIIKTVLLIAMMILIIV